MARARFEVESVARFQDRNEAFVLARTLDGVAFEVTDGATLDGCPLDVFLEIPRALGADGKPRLDLFAFKLRREEDLPRFTPGQVVELAFEGGPDTRRGMDETRVRALVAELDALVPREGARARLDVYGGAPDESYVIASQAGALRLGIEVLRGTLAAMDDGANGRRPVGRIDLEDVLDDDSTFLIDHVELADPLPPPNRARVTDIDAPLPPSKMIIFAAGAVIGVIVGFFLG